MQSLSAISKLPPKPETQLDTGGLQNTQVNDFLKLMIAELQQQDPLDPMKNSEMLQQLNQIRSIGATDQLTHTLKAVLIGQNLATASSLIGKDVRALTDEGLDISGRVERVTVTPASDNTASSVRVHIGDQRIALSNVREILTTADANP